MDYAWFLFDFVGRINRARFWLAVLIIAWWMLPFFIIPGVFDQFDDRLPDSYPFLALSLAAATLWLWGVVEMCFLKGTTGPNRYGADPVAQRSPRARAPRWDQQNELELIP